MVNMQTFPFGMPHHLSYQSRIMNGSTFGLRMRAIRDAVKSPKSGLQQTRSNDQKIKLKLKLKNPQELKSCFAL